MANFIPSILPSRETTVVGGQSYLKFPCSSPCPVHTQTLYSKWIFSPEIKDDSFQWEGDGTDTLGCMVIF